MKNIQDIEACLVQGIGKCQKVMHGLRLGTMAKIHDQGLNDAAALDGAVDDEWHKSIYHMHGCVEVAMDTCKLL